MKPRDLTLNETLTHLSALLKKLPPPKNGPESSFLQRIQLLHDALHELQTPTPSLKQLTDHLFPQLKPESRRVTLSNFRDALTKTSLSLGHTLALIQPDGRGRTAEQIVLHFEGIPLTSSLEEITRKDTAKLSTYDQTPPRMTPDVIRIFISFAVADKSSALTLKSMIAKAWGDSRQHKIKLWIFTDFKDGGVIAGEKNKDIILEAIASCPIGLFMLSPDSCNSAFIKNHELPPYLDHETGKHPILINLRSTRTSSKHFPAACEGRNIYSFEKNDQRHGFDELEKAHDRESFAAEVCDHIEALCKKHFSRNPTTPQEKIIPHFVRDQIIDESLIPGSYSRKDQGLDTVTDLLEWAESSARPNYFALLGEVGSGKSTASLMFAKALNERPSDTRAYYFDLRYVNYDGLLENNKRPLIEDILRSILRRHEVKNHTPADYLHALQHQGAILIFDGLDEVFVSLSDAERNAFMHQLLSALPIAALREKGAGKLLLACRTHYFRDSITESGGFTLQGREGLHIEDGNPAPFELARMLPFTEDQIKSYFAANIPDLPFDQLWTLLGEIHNLRELATQPYLLNLIRQQLPRINSLREQNKPVLPVDLYAGFISDWTQAHNEFHNVMRPDDKTELMELLAAHLWQKGTKTFHAKDMETWLRKTILHHPEWSLVYADLLKPREESLFSDFRTASFVTRWQGDTFRFAHTSLQEYFLAAHLAKSLLTDSPELAWDLPKPSLETFDFLGQILEKSAPREQQKATDQIASTLANPNAPEQARRCALEYHLLAFQKNHPTPAAPDLALGNMDLGGLKLIGTEEKPLHFGKADFSGSFLGDTTFEFAHFAPGANFTNADTRGFQPVGCSLQKADFSDTKGGLIFARKCDLTGIIEDDTNSQKRIRHFCLPYSPHTAPQNLRLESQGHSHYVNSASFSPDGSRIASASWDRTLKLWDAASGQCLLSLSGHSSFVTYATFSPDGSHIISASEDKTLKLWDAASGNCLLTLEGHSNTVTSGAFSPDGSHIISASEDKTLKVWDATSGNCILSLAGHSDTVTSAAFSPDGSRIASASMDRTLKLWNAVSGQCLITFGGHSSDVTSAAFSPDGTHIISASEDKTLKLWDATSGNCILSLGGHSDTVTSASFSPNGAHIVSASWDDTLKLWDATSGKCLLTLAGHSNWVSSAAFSPDGKHILSSSYDKTLKLWNVALGQCILSLSGHSGDIIFAAFSPDDTQMAAKFLWGNTLVWSLEGENQPVPDDAGQWFKIKPARSNYSLDLISDNALRISKNNRILREIRPLENGSHLVLIPWDEHEAKKSWDDNSIRWKLSRGPADYWRYLHCVDSETLEIHPPELALADDFTIIDPFR